MNIILKKIPGHLAAKQLQAIVKCYAEHIIE